MVRVKHSKSDKEGLPLIIDLSNLLLFLSCRFPVPVRNLARVRILRYEFKICDPINAFLKFDLVLLLVKEHVLVHEVWSSGDNGLLGLPDVTLGPLELAQLVVLPHA